MHLIFLLACSSAPPVCSTDSDVIHTASGELSCVDAKIPSRFIRVLAGRPLNAGSTAIGVGSVAEKFEKDPESTKRWLRSMRIKGAAIEHATGMAAAELRSQEVFRAVTGKGPITESDKALWNLQSASLSVWARDDEEQLALTESDIEGWISYASLCHEVQGTGVMRVSVAQKVDIYRMTKERFEQGSRAEMLALSSLGPVWSTVRERWQAAEYDAQQVWIRSAPRPEPMAGSPLGYYEAVLELNLPKAAHSIHSHFGPLHFRDGPGYFSGSPQ